MDLDGILALFLLVLHWRVVAAAVGGSVIGYALVKFIPWFAAPQGILVACVGLVAGLIWQSTVEVARTVKSQATPAASNTAPSTVVVAAGLFGAIWGAASSSSMHSAVAGGAILLALAYGWLKYVQSHVPNLARSHALLSVTVAALAYPIAVAVAHSAA